jgi:hypothetical protein
VAQVIDVPRPLLGTFLGMPESAQCAVYVLLGDEPPDRRSVFMAPTDELRLHLTRRDEQRSDWSRVLVLTSRALRLTWAHVDHVAWICQRALRHAGYRADDARPLGPKPLTSGSIEAECRDLFATSQLILTTLGLSLFDTGGGASEARLELAPPRVQSVASSPSRQAVEPSVPVRAVEPSPAARTIEPSPSVRAVEPSPPAAASAERIYRCTLLGSLGYGRATPEGFVVLKGSRGPRHDKPKLSGALRQFRQDLLRERVMYEDGAAVVFDQDHLFTSSSLAAVALTGQTCDGGMEWKTEDGRTLFAVRRELGLDRR